MLIPSQNWNEEIVVDSALVKTNLQEIQKDIAHSKVKIVAVTKYFGINAIKAGYEAGIRDFGESRAIDAIRKIEQLYRQMRLRLYAGRPLPPAARRPAGRCHRWPAGRGGSPPEKFARLQIRAL